MSYWGAQVIVNLFGTIPVIGPGLVEWIRGDYGIADSTLNRFFSLHVVAVPFALAFLILMHLVALRQTGSNNPDGIEIKQNLGADGKPVDGAASTAPQPVPLTAEELAKVEALVKQAVGFSAERGDSVAVQNASFIAPEVPTVAPLPLWPDRGSPAGLSTAGPCGGPRAAADRGAGPGAGRQTAGAATP